MNSSETDKVQRFLRQKFGNHGITLKTRGETNDSVELLIDDRTDSFSAPLRRPQYGALGVEKHTNAYTRTIRHNGLCPY